ncbi:hypothetical protein Leryth_013633 [Lithospermum erythrorhizon]|nr:hypothetical protein Leryth_013633 [Lithospermum erythrorhizon]
MTETVTGGVPVICFPWFADQTTNYYYSCNWWGIGTEINHEVKHDHVSQQIVAMMQGEKGKEMRRNAQELKRRAC